VHLLVSDHYHKFYVIHLYIVLWKNSGIMKLLGLLSRYSLWRKCFLRCWNIWEKLVVNGLL